jgi:hypothetical protein
MKPIFLLAFFVLAGFPTRGQDAKLPSVLIPDASAQAEAQLQGVKVFKILPRGMYATYFNAYKDEENPLGIREGGSFFSFSTGSHSYNSIPQIGLEQGTFNTGFAGMNYGLITDLGRLSLSNVTVDTEEVRYLSSYKPFRFEKQSREEAQNVHGRKVGNATYFRHIPARLGHTYVLRAITFGHADVLAALHVLRVDSDGSMIILWQQLADFGKPIVLYVSDEYLRGAISKIIESEGLKTIQVEVKDNVLIYHGKPSSSELNQFSRVLRDNNIRTRGSDFSHRVIEK